MGKRIVVLGAGFVGLAAAHELRNGLGPGHRVTVVDRQPLFFMGLTKLWVLDGRRAVGDRPGNRTLLARRGIDFNEGEVASIKAEERVVQVAKQKLACEPVPKWEFTPPSAEGFRQKEQFFEDRMKAWFG